MTTITTYAELKQNIQDFVKRNDILSKLDLFIDLAEADIWEVLRVREMETRAIASSVADSRFLSLPIGFIKMRRLQITVNDVQRDINWKDIKNMQIYSDTGVPFEYAITEEIQFNRAFDEVYSLEMEYFKEMEPLSNAYPANSVLINYPLIYLSGCLVHAFNWAMQEEKSQYWRGIFDAETARANRKSRQGRYGPAPSISIQGMVV